MLSFRQEYTDRPITLKGTIAVETTVRYIQTTRAQVKEKLKALKG